MMPKHNLERWLVTVDERRARLFCCTPTVHVPWHVQETEILRNQWENDHEHHRPAMLGRSRPTAPLPPHEVALGHEAEEEHRRFAHDVAAWLKEHAILGKTKPLLVFAAPRLLGVLRSCVDSADSRLRLIERELAGLQPHELAEHPAVLEELSL